MTEDRGPELYHKVRAAFDKYIEFTHPWHSAILATYVMQTYVKDVLHGVFYVGMLGPKGSGKTTVLEVTTELSGNGLMTGNTSVPALARAMNEGVDLAVDELDEMKGDILELVQAAMRQGYRRGSTYLRYDPKAKALERVNTFSPKIVSFRTGIEDALASRTYPIPMAPAHRDPVGRALLNMTRDLTALRDELRAWGAEAVKAWPQARVDSVIRSEVFQRRITEIIGPTGTPREVEIAADMMLVSLMVGVNVMAEISSATEGQRQAAYDDDLQLLRDFIVSEWDLQGKPKELESETIRSKWNMMRRDHKEPPYSQFKFRSSMRELGFRDGETLVRNTRRGVGVGRSMLRVTTEWVEGVEGLLAAQPADDKSLNEFRKSLSETPKSPGAVGTAEGLLKEFEERLKDSLNRGAVHGPGGEKSFSAEDADLVAASVGYPRDRVLPTIERWKRDGLLLEPRLDGRYKFP